MDRDSRKGSFGSALIWITALSILLCWIPIIGPLLAGAAGGRRAGGAGSALLAGAVPGALWALLLLALARRELHLAGQEIVIGSIALLALPTASAIISGALVGSGTSGARIAGALVLAASLLWFLPNANDVRKIVVNIAQASQVQYEPAKNKTCPENLRQLFTAAQLYADSWDGKLPPANRWMTALQPNVTKDEWLHCPEVSRRAGPKYGYAMNPDAGGKKLDELKTEPNIPLFYDSSDLAKDAHPGLATLPKPGRHAGRNNIVYADGHVEQK